MDEKDFKKHLADLVHGHHHPEEHDWSDDTVLKTKAPSKTAKTGARKTKQRKK
jgi:hypothetical protein